MSTILGEDTYSLNAFIKLEELLKSINYPFNKFKEQQNKAEGSRRKEEKR